MHLLEITIPDDNFIPEREYTIDVVFNEFLGLEYFLKKEKRKTATVIKLSEKDVIFNIEDGFWSNKKNEVNIYNSKNLPKEKVEISDPFNKKTLIGLFGKKKIEVSEGKIDVGIDIFASVFFMLTRWEEYVNKTRDNHGRFPGEESKAYELGFLHRPIVNEYLDFIWEALKYLGYKGGRKKRQYNLIPTHDVDFLTFPNKKIKYFVHDLLMKRSIQSFINRVKYCFCDPYNSFNFLMQTSEKHNVKSRFYFYAGGLSLYDTQNYLKKKKLTGLVEEIKKRGHIIGFHSSYQSYHDKELFLKEKKEVEKATKQQINQGRQHYLRFEVPETWRMYNNCDMKTNSTMGYPDHFGFRCGVCYDFPVFDFLERKQLLLFEQPLIMMETTAVIYRKLNSRHFSDEIEKYKSVVKRYDGNLVILWHNSSFNVPPWNDYQHLYHNYFS